jgi:hypothetical protein
MTLSASDFVLLKGGLTLPLAALRLTWDLENRGLELTTEGGDILIAGPRERLTDDDRAALRRWKRHILVLLAYNPPEVG